MVARRVTPFILDDLVSYVDMLDNFSFVMIAGVYHLFDCVRGDFQKFFKTSIFFTANYLLFSLTTVLIFLLSATSFFL